MNPVPVFVMVLAVFMLGGGVSFMAFLFHVDQYWTNVKELAYSPVALASYSFGFMGTGLLVLAGRNLKEHAALAQKQILVGFTLIIVAYVGLELSLKSCWG